MSDKFKFSKTERRELKFVLQKFFAELQEYSIPIDRIEQIVQDRGNSIQETDDEFTELVYRAKRVQSLYRCSRYGLADEEQAELIEFIDDIKRIPSAPKQPKK